MDEGELGSGNRIEVIHRPDHHVTVNLIGHAYYNDLSRAGELLEAETLPSGWREWAEKTVAREPQRHA